MSAFVVRFRLHCASVVGVALLVGHLGLTSAVAADGKDAQSAGASQEGHSLYTANCSSCHGKALDGSQFGPPLSGEAFEKKWNRRWDDLLKKISETMPLGSPGSLDTASYQAITQYIQDQNHGLKGRNVPPSGGADHGSQVTEYLNSPVGFAPAEAFQSAPYQKIKQEREALLAGLTPVSEEMITLPAAKDWVTWRGTSGRQSFSALKQIDKRNVRTLGVAWAWSLPAGPNEIEPLVHDGVMFVASGHEVQALDATTGNLLWRYKRKDNPKYDGIFYQIHRAIALYGASIFATTDDRHLIALDVKTGKLLWDKEIAPDSSDAFVASGPFVAHGKIITSTTGGPVCGPSCAITAFDAVSGEKLWTFNTIAGPDDPNGDTWNGVPADERSGGGVWIPGSYDAKTGLIYVSIGQTYKAEPLLQAPNDAHGKGDALYTNSTVALDPDTGHLAWFHQHFARDVWDMDEAFEQTFVTIPAAAKSVDAIASIGKTAILDVIDRHSGKYLFSVDAGLQNFIQSIDPVTGRRTVKPEFDDPKPGMTYEICPASLGAKTWITTAYDPASGLIYIPLQEDCMDYKWAPHKGSRQDIGYNMKPMPNSDGNFARLIAVDLKTRKVVWMTRDRSTYSSSLLATSGGLLFTGSQDRKFQAVDSQTGKTLWSTMLNAMPSSSPMTYSVNGVQYIAVVAGGGAPGQVTRDVFNPETDKGVPSTTVWVFRLPAAK